MTHLKKVEWYEIGLPRYTTINVCQKKKHDCDAEMGIFVIYGLPFQFSGFYYS
jgi:hypothetical protein